MKRILYFLIPLAALFGHAPAHAAVTTDNVAYGSSVTITCTLNSLGSSATVGRSCASVSNTTNLAIDAYVTVISSTGNGALANDKAIYVYLYGADDGTNFDQEESNNPGTDASYTINAITIFKGPVVIPVLTAGKQYVKVFNVAPFFGGVLPRKWGLIVVNFSGQALGSAGNTISYSPITYTNQ